jgi:hypothetical protein
MSEVGLLPFARIALQVAKAVLPRYRSRFSKHQFRFPGLRSRCGAGMSRTWPNRCAGGCRNG